MNDAEKLISEIHQIATQYREEVGRGRKAWPKSIKDRIVSLFLMGLRGKEIAHRTKVPYYSVLKWRPKKEKASELPVRKFREIAIKPEKPEKVATVTVPSFESKKVVMVTVTTPDGYQIQVPMDGVAGLLKNLRGSGA